MIEVLKLALEVLEELNETQSYWWQDVDEETVAKIDPAIIAIKQAIAELESQEPVAWMYVNTDGECEQIEYGEPFDDPSTTPLYTHPPQRTEQEPQIAFNAEVVGYVAPQRTWVGLTDEEIDQGFVRTNYAMQTAGAWRDGVEWATKQLREKNNG